MRLAEYLSRYAAAEIVRMHMPGHKGTLSPFDLTETEYSEQGRIEAAVEETEREIGAAYGYARARLLSGGSTLGLLAAVTALPPGRVLTPRATHKSVWSACALGGREPVVFETESIFVQPDPEQIRRAVETSPDLVGMVVTSPDYFGRAADLAAIKAALGKRALIVDAAHGAHFGLRPEFPPSPSLFGDCTVLSAHKTLKSLTQSAFALVRPEFASSFERTVSMFETTSPSYLLYASAEEGVRHARATDCTALIERIRRLPYRVETDDPMRIVLDAHAAGTDGADFARALGSQGVVAEFATDRYVVLIATACDTPETLARLHGVLEGLSFERRVFSEIARPEPRGERAEPFIAERETEDVALSRAAGRVAANEVGFYPPCRPAIVRGERYTPELVRALSGRTVFGVTDGKVTVRK